MAISRIQSTAATPVDSGTSISKAFGSNVTTGSLVVVICNRFTSAADAFLAADVTKSAGTATIGTVALDRQNNLGSSNDCATGIFSAIVTSGGSLTMQAGGAGSGSALIMAIVEYGGIWDASRAEAVNGTTNTTGTPSSGNATSAGAAVFVGGLATSTAGSTTHTPDVAWNQLSEEENGTLHMTGSMIDRIVSSGTTDDASWTAPTGIPWAASVVVYKEAAAGGGGSPLIVPRGLSGGMNDMARGL